MISFSFCLGQIPFYDRQTWSSYPYRRTNSTYDWIEVYMYYEYRYIISAYMHMYNKERELLNWTSYTYVTQLHIDNTCIVYI